MVVFCVQCSRVSRHCNPKDFKEVAHNVTRQVGSLPRSGVHALPGENGRLQEDADREPVVSRRVREMGPRGALVR